MNRRILAILTFIIMFIGSISACSNTEMIETPATAPVISPTLLHTATSTPIPTPTTTPTPSRPGLPSPVLAPVSEPISLNNVQRLSLLGSLGIGDLESVVVSPDHKWVVFDTSTGLALLDTMTLETQIFLPTNLHSYGVSGYSVSFVDEGQKIRAVNIPQTEGYIWSIPEGKLLNHINFDCILDQTGKNNVGSAHLSDDLEYVVKFEYNYHFDGWNSYPSYDDSVFGLCKTGNGEIQYTVNFKVTNYKVSLDEEKIAISTPEKLMILDYRTGNIIYEIPEVGIKSFFFYPDGKILAAIYNNQIKFWSMDDYQLIGSIRGSDISLLGFSPDQSILALKSNGSIRLLRAEDRLLINGFAGCSIMFSSNNQGLLIDNCLGQVNYYLFNSDRSKVILESTFSGKGIYDDWQQPIKAGVFSSDNKNILLTKTTGVKYSDFLTEIRNVELTTGEIIRFPFENNAAILIDAIWIPGLETYGVLVRDLDGFCEFFVLEKDSATIREVIGTEWANVYRALNFSAQSDLLVFAQGNHLYSWDIKNNNYWELPLDQVDLPYSSLRPKIEFSGMDDKTFLYTNVLNVTYEYDTSTYSLVKQYPGFAGEYGSENATSNDRKFNANRTITNNGMQITIIDNLTGQMLYELGGGYDSNFSFSPDSNMIAIASNGGWGNEVNIYDLTTGNSVFSTGGYYCGGVAPKITFSPDGNYLAVLCEFGYPQIWGIP